MKNKTEQKNQHISFNELDELVHKLAWILSMRTPSSSMTELDDLIQVGRMAGLEALEKYDVTKGASIETYAGIRINGAMLDELRRMDPLPKARRRRIREGLEKAPVFISIDEIDENDYSNFLLALLPTTEHDHVFNEVLLQELEEQVENVFKDDKRRLASLYRYTDLTLAEIARLAGLTESRICQIYTEATKNVRQVVNG